MSTRTVLEINHDYLHDIALNPERLVMFVRSLGSSQYTAVNTAPNGIRVLGQRHHSETLKLEIK